MRPIDTMLWQKQIFHVFPFTYNGAEILKNHKKVKSANISKPLRNLRDPNSIKLHAKFEINRTGSFGEEDD